MADWIPGLTLKWPAIPNITALGSNSGIVPYFTNFLKGLQGAPPVYGTFTGFGPSQEQLALEKLGFSIGTQVHSGNYAGALMTSVTQTPVLTGINNPLSGLPNTNPFSGLISWLTSWLSSASAWLQKYWWAILLVLAGLLFGYAYLSSTHININTGKAGA